MDAVFMGNATFPKALTFEQVTSMLGAVQTASYRALAKAPPSTSRASPVM